MSASPESLEQRKTALFSRIAAIMERTTIFPLGDEIAILEMEDACDKAEAEPHKQAAQTFLYQMIDLVQTGHFTRRLTHLNDILVPFGRCAKLYHCGACKAYSRVRSTQ